MTTYENAFMTTDGMTYDEAYTAWMMGQITQEEWTSFCTYIMQRIIEDNAELYARMKQN